MLKIKSQKGFTIVELLIVIVVIGILAALVLNTFQGVQKRARDTQRQNAVNSMSTQLEAYYTDHGSYPSAADLANDTWIQNNLKGFDLKATKAPGKSTNSYQATTASNKDEFGYVTTPTGAGCGSPTTAANPPVEQAASPAACTKFTLSWYSEDKSAVNSKDSLNN